MLLFFFWKLNKHMQFKPISFFNLKLQWYPKKRWFIKLLLWILVDSVTVVLWWWIICVSYRLYEGWLYSVGYADSIIRYLTTSVTRMNLSKQGISFSIMTRPDYSCGRKECLDNWKGNALISIQWWAVIVTIIV